MMPVKIKATDEIRAKLKQLISISSEWYIHFCRNDSFLKQNALRKLGHDILMHKSVLAHFCLHAIGYSKDSST